MKAEREYSFDVLRTISMIMVITIHVSNVYCRNFDIISSNSYLISLIFNTISRISVPLFFMISGALLLNRNFSKTKYLNRLIKYLILIFAWDIIYLFWEYFFLDIDYDQLFRLFFTPYRAHLWFLYSILVIYAVQPILKITLTKANKGIKVILFLIWFLLSTLSMYSNVIAKYFTIFSYIGYFCIGKYLYDFVKEQDLKKYNIISIIMLVFLYTGSIYLNFVASKRFNMFYNTFFAYRTPYIIFATFIFFILIYNIYHSKKPNKIILLLSNLSLGVYLIHGIYLDITCKLFNYSNINSLLGIPLFTVIIFILSIVTVYLLRKSKILSKIFS